MDSCVTSDVRLIQGDCLDVMRTLPDGSVDAIVTDPPYGQSNESYDKGVPDEVWAECYRVARPNAALISFAGSPTYHRIASGIERGGWRVRQMWGWVYRDGMITSAYPKEGFDRLAPAMDPICFATKGKVLLRVEREGTAWKATRTKCGYSNRATHVSLKTEASGHYPKSLVSDGSEEWEYFAHSRTNGYRDERVGHPNQKPLALMRWVVAKLPTGAVILDPYMGSGTTLKAAIEGGHRAIGIESDPAHFATAQARLDAAQARMPLFAALPRIAPIAPIQPSLFN